MAEGAPSAAPEIARRLLEAKRAAPTRAPEKARPTRAGAEVRLGTKGVLSATISPNISSCSTAETFGEPKAANRVSRNPSISPDRMARLRRAGAAIERRPAMAASPAATRYAGAPTSSSLCQRTPHLQLGLYVPDHFVGELAGPSVSSKVQRPVPLEH